MSPAAVATSAWRRTRPRQPRRPRRFRLRMQQARPRSRSVTVATDRRRPLRQPRTRPLRQRRHLEMTVAAQTVATPNLRPRQGLIPAEANHKMEQRPPARKRPSVRATSATTSAGAPVGACAGGMRTGNSWTIVVSTASTEIFLEAGAKRTLETDTRSLANGGTSIGGGAISPQPIRLQRARALHRPRRLGTPGPDGWPPIARGTAALGEAQRRAPSSVQRVFLRSVSASGTPQGA